MQTTVELLRLKEISASLGYSSRTSPWQVLGQKFSSSLNLPSAAHILILCWTSLLKVQSFHDIWHSMGSKETLTDSVQTSLFSITLASPTTFPISLSRDAKDSWACKGETTISKDWAANPHLPESTRDTEKSLFRRKSVLCQICSGDQHICQDWHVSLQSAWCMSDCLHLKAILRGSFNSLVSSY